MKPNRQQWANVMADAALNYGQVMNEAIVVFDTETGQFDWQSSLTPLADSEVEVETDVRWEHYTGGDDEPTMSELANWFADDFMDETWESTKALISA